MTGHYAARTLISKYTSDVAALFLERGAIDASAPVVSNLVTEIVSRVGIVVSDKFAADALRRLERTYGSAHIRQHYATLATKLPKLAGRDDGHAIPE